MLQMPVVKPLPIKTKNRSVLMRIIVWIFEIRKWELYEDWYYILPDGKKLKIEAGFVFDGASIPRPLWAVLSPAGLLFIPGLVHDFGYKYDYLMCLDEDGVARKEYEGAGKRFWDKMFRQVGIDVNGFAFINIAAWLALVIGGWFAWWKYRRAD